MNRESLVSPHHHKINALGVESTPSGAAKSKHSPACVDCIVVWSEWSRCVAGQRLRQQVVKIEQVGNGSPCPKVLGEQVEICNVTGPDSVSCRFSRSFLLQGRTPVMRDILLLGDESGSIGWVNYEKIKDVFKAVARNMHGGVGPQATQIAMMSFARWARPQFGFDAFDNANDAINGISLSIFRGGYRSKIGQALTDANTWMFQQSEGMRSFPGRDDNINHEILIATDGCRTSKGYYFRQGLRAIRRRGIKLSVIGLYSHDPRCQQTIREMVEDPTDVYEVGGWEDLVRFTQEINTEDACVL